MASKITSIRVAGGDEGIDVDARFASMTVSTTLLVADALEEVARGMRQKALEVLEEDDEP